MTVSESNKARARKATHCPKGHALTIDNLIRYRDRGRFGLGCKICYRARQLRYYVSTGLVLPIETPSVISGYKKPLTKVHNGYGYLGTIAFNKGQTHTQCHVCGYFFINLSTHARKQHGIKIKDYKDVFGIGRGVSLMAPISRQQYYDRWNQLSSDEKLKRVTDMQAARTMTQKEAGALGNGMKKSLHKKNLEGRCPEQLLHKIQKLADKLGKTPSRKEFQREYRDEGEFIGSIFLTFGTWTEALKILNLTPRTAPGGRPIYDQATLIIAMQDFQKRYGREPFFKDIRAGLLPSYSTFKRHFGSFSRAKEFIR